jgi:3-dehydroquinate synthase
MGYGVWLHGEAVAAGTIMAADLSRRMGWLSQQDEERVRKLFERTGLPVVAPKLGAETYQQLMGLDKKVADGKVRFVLLKSLGSAVMTGDVPQALLEQTLEACSA